MTASNSAVSFILRTATSLAPQAYLAKMESWSPSDNNTWGGSFEASLIAMDLGVQIAIFEEHPKLGFKLLVVAGTPSAESPLCVIWNGIHYNILKADAKAIECVQGLTFR